MKITRKEVQLFQHIGKTLFIDTPANLEYSDGTPATDQDFRAIVTLRAALSVFQTMGIVQEDVKIELKEPFEEDFKDD